MTKKKTTGRSTAKNRPGSTTSLKQRLKQLNREIARLCNERALSVRDSDRPEQIAHWLQAEQANSLARQKGPLSVEGLKAVFRELDSATRSLVEQDRVAFLGPEFSYSHLAAVSRFGQSGELMAASSIRGVFESVERGDAEFGVVPIENSTDGRIVDTLERFVESPVRICGEVPLPIHHNLLAIGSLAEIREIQSKPQALSQCRNWLSRHMPNVRQVAANSTTGAAQAAAQDKRIAAIASRQAGINYGLNVIAANIEDNPENVTRFAVIGMETAKRTGNDKTSLMFELHHQPGALADAMSIFKRNRLNLTWIESFPMKGSPNEYLFFVELEGHSGDAAVRRAIRSMNRKTVRIEILGSYPRGQGATTTAKD